MKVIALIYGEEQRWESASEEERNAMYERYRAFAETADGKILDGAELAPTRTATTVRVRDGETIVTDGPYAETKEQLGGLLSARGGQPRRRRGARDTHSRCGDRSCRDPSGSRGGVMKYLLLLNNDTADVEAWRKLSPADAQQARGQELPRWNELFAWMEEQGITSDGLELEDASEARVVRVRGSETLVSDGPFAETKELLGSYFLADCKDLDQAIELAQRVPLASRGSVEIRPLVTQ
jgi:hypothetical protein